MISSEFHPNSSQIKFREKTVYFYALLTLSRYPIPDFDFPKLLKQDFFFAKTRSSYYDDK
jgi:hypothetical protein